MPKDTKPKAPKSAYFLFQDDVKPSLTAKSPELAKNVAALAKETGAAWKALSDEQKKKYEAKAASLKAAYEKEHGPIVRGKAAKEAKEGKAAKGGKEAKGKAAPAKAAKGKKEDGPKRAQSAYMFYSNAVRSGIAAENPGQPVTEIAKIIGAKWKTLTDGEKAKYEAQAAADKARYEKEKAQ